MTAPVVRRVAGLAVVGLLIGCGSGGTGAAEGGGAQASSGAPSAEAGISAEEARERGVLSAEFDARLEPPPGAVEGAVRGSATFRLDNMGAAADVYDLTVDPPSAGSVDPATVELDPGESAEVTVTLAAPEERSVLRIASAGRQAEIAAFVLSDR